MRSALHSSQLKELIESVYGSWHGAASAVTFPLPLPSEEAGPCRHGQRRYLWTDSFAILNFLSMAHHRNLTSAHEGERECVEAAKHLAHTVKETLGYPRPDGNFPMLKRSDGRSGYVGLRIGKLEARSESDAGMAFDGQYWHYLDKWLFANSRLALYLEDKSMVGEVMMDAKEILEKFLSVNNNGTPQGLHWKLNTDMSPIVSLGRPRPSSDAVSAYVVYNVIEQTAKKLGYTKHSLEKEIEALRQVALQYSHAQLQIPNPLLVDPLGWGLNMWELQWLGPLEDKEHVKHRFCSFKDRAMDVSQAGGLPFRLYGAVLGGLLSEDMPTFKMAKSIVNDIESKLNTDSNADQGAISKVHGLFSINRVMFCSTIDPWAFSRQPHEELLDFFVSPIESKS